ncbi:MAG: class I SAM-dependent methyltransferase [Rhodospirillales bacterium]|nr:class I SAM-dependent methyltransferase [Rhodospirillales bacterium]
MKQQLKAILPAPVWTAAREAVSWAQLVSLPKGNFDPANLRSFSSVALADVFEDQGIGKTWDDDHNAIASLFGNDDNMGGVNPGDRRAIYYLIMALKPQDVLEVGTHIGASTLHIVSALKRLGQGGHLTSADICDVNDPENGPWKKLGMPASPRDFCAKLGCADLVDFHVGPCQDYMRGTDQQYDFIFLDGDHRASAVYQELSVALPLLKPGGAVLLHDYYPEAKPLYPDNNIISGPFHALARVRKENPAIRVLPLGELPWPTKQGTNVTTLALVLNDAT